MKVSSQVRHYFGPIHTEILPEGGEEVALFDRFSVGPTLELLADHRDSTW